MGLSLDTATDDRGRVTSICPIVASGDEPGLVCTSSDRTRLSAARAAAAPLLLTVSVLVCLACASSLERRSSRFASIAGKRAGTRRHSSASVCSRPSNRRANTSAGASAATSPPVEDCGVPPGCIGAAATASAAAGAAQSALYVLTCSLLLRASASPSAALLTSAPCTGGGGMPSDGTLFCSTSSFCLTIASIKASSRAPSGPGSDSIATPLSPALISASNASDEAAASAPLSWPMGG